MVQNVEISQNLSLDCTVLLATESLKIFFPHHSYAEYKPGSHLLSLTSVRVLGLRKKTWLSFLGFS